MVQAAEWLFYVQTQLKEQYFFIQCFIFFRCTYILIVTICFLALHSLEFLQRPFYIIQERARMIFSFENERQTHNYRSPTLSSFETKVSYKQILQ